MRIRIVEGPGSPWEGIATIDDAGIVVDGRGYSPLDDLRGIIVVEMTRDEQQRLLEYGFDLDVEQ